MSRFRIIVPSYDCAPWLEKCLGSIEAQRYDDYDVCVVDDASPSAEHAEVARRYCERNGWQLVVNETRRGPLFSKHAAFTAVNPDDNDIVCIFGGDDWLAHPNVLSCLSEVHEREDVWVTDGGSRAVSTTPARQERAVGLNTLMRERRAWFVKHQDVIVERSLYRRIPFCYLQPHSFRAFLWRHIDPRDFRQSDGTWFTASGDHVYLFALSELSGGRLAMLEDVHHVYNIHERNFDADPRIEPHRSAVKALIRSRPPYTPLSAPP